MNFATHDQIQLTYKIDHQSFQINILTFYIKRKRRSGWVNVNKIENLANHVPRAIPGTIFTCEFYEKFKRTFSTEHLWATASEHITHLALLGSIYIRVWPRTPFIDSDKFRQSSLLTLFVLLGILKNCFMKCWLVGKIPLPFIYIWYEMC